MLAGGPDPDFFCLGHVRPVHDLCRFEPGCDLDVTLLFAKLIAFRLTLALLLVLVVALLVGITLLAMFLALSTLAARWLESPRDWLVSGA